MTFSDLEVAVSQFSRKHGYIRDNVLTIWTPGAGNIQHAYSRELAGAMLCEADEFFDRALALYLLRNHLRELQASTWAGVACWLTATRAQAVSSRLTALSASCLAGK